MASHYCNIFSVIRNMHFSQEHLHRRINLLWQQLEIVTLGADGSTLEFLTLQGNTRASPKQDNGCHILTSVP